MEPEIPPRSLYDQDKREDELSPEAAIAILIQALNQVEIASTQLSQVFGQQAAEVEALGLRIKQQHKVTRALKHFYDEQYWWKAVADEVRMYQIQNVDEYRNWLITFVQENYSKEIAAFKLLQENVDILYPQ